MDITTLRRIATDCISITEDSDSTHLDLELAIALGWKIRASSSGDATYWEIPILNPASPFSSDRIDRLPLFTTLRDDACSLLSYIGDSYGYHVVKKSSDSYAAVVDWKGPGSGADGRTEVGALLASILFTIANKQEALQSDKARDESLPG